MKTLITVGTLLLGCSLFAAAEATPTQIDLSATPCRCQQVQATAQSNDQAPATVATPDSMASPVGVNQPDQVQFNSQDLHQITR